MYVTISVNTVIRNLVREFFYIMSCSLFDADTSMSYVEYVEAYKHQFINLSVHKLIGSRARKLETDS
jgi:hypothetical protein